MDRIEILGIEIDNVSWDEALDRMREMIRSGKPHHVVTPAIEQVVRARRDPDFHQVYSNAELVLADGMQLVFAARWHNTPLKARITGVDMVPALCQMAAQEGFRVFLFGGGEGVADETAQKLQNDIPGLTIAGTYSPPFGFENNPEEEQKAIQLIRDTQPDILFVALRTPRMETWIDRRKEELGVPVMMGIGGAFDFIIGRQKRAPRWLQQIGMEGFHRFLYRPKDIGKRILTHAPYFFLLLVDRFTYRTQKRIAQCIRPLALGVVDVFVAPFCFVFSYWLYFRSNLFSNQADPFPVRELLDMPAYSDLLIFVAILSIASNAFFRLYERDKYITLITLFYNTLKASLASVFLLIGFQFVFKDLFKPYEFDGFSRVVFGFFGSFYFLSLWGWRTIFHQLEHVLHRIGINMDRIIVVGTNPTALNAVKTMKSRPELGNLPLGFIATNDTFNSNHEFSPILGKIEDMKRLLPARKVDEVLIADSTLPLNQLIEIVRTCRENRVSLSIIPTIHALLGVSSEIKRIGNFRVITVKPDHHIDSMLEVSEKSVWP